MQVKMSKIRNRSVKTLPHELSTVLISSHKNKLKTNYQEVGYFGENVQDINVTSPYMPLSTYIAPQSFSTFSSGDVDSITLELNKLSGLSSSSSPSWSDEYESETTKKLQDELERMDRVLRGEEPIPSHYDKDEYKQWMNTFPNLSIFDRQITPTNSTQNIPELLQEKKGELVIYGKDHYNLMNCDTLTSKKKKKQAVIDVSENSQNKLLNQRSGNRSRKRKLEDNRNKNRNIFTISHKPKSLDTDKYLRISSIKNQVNERKLSSKSLLNREISKEYPDSTLEYNSLPFIKVEELDYSKGNIGSSISQSRKYSSEKPRKKIDTHLVLPPIVMPNQFRSISATPRNGNKTISMFSTKYDSLKDYKSRKLSVSFLENPVSHR